MSNFIKMLCGLVITFTIITIKEPSSQAEYELINIHPFDKTAFTQGLEMHNEQLLLGTGLYGKSLIAYVNLVNGEIEVIDKLDNEYFGEGLTVTEDYVWQLTWRENTALKRTLDSLEIIESVYYEGEGWGLAYDEERKILWMSDGTSYLYQRDPLTFELIDKMKVTYNNQEIDNINELEYANGRIYANIWYTNQVIAINPETAFVTELYDFSDLLEEELNPDQLLTIDSLNGIAHIEGNRFYITGKFYPVIFEIELKY